MINRVIVTIERLPYRIIRFSIGVLIIAAVGYLVMTILANSCSPSGIVKTPNLDEAQYSILIRNTGGIILTSDYTDIDGVITIKGYWERRGSKFVYKDKTAVLDESVFGPIDIKPRVVR